MARIPYADCTSDAVRPLADRIAAERGSVLHLYQMLLHSPPFAEGWLKYLTAVRHQSSLSGALRELIIMRVALLNNAPYEADQHAPIALRELIIMRVALLNNAPYEADQHAPIALAEGVDQAKLDALAQWQDCDRFDERERAVLAYTDAMTRHVQVPDAVFAAVSALHDPKDLVEITATIAAYNMVSRFLEALQIHSHDER